MGVQEQNAESIDILPTLSRGSPPEADMDLYIAPDGTHPENAPLTTAYWFTLPARCAAALLVFPNSVRENVALIHLQGYLLDTQIGGWMDRPVTANVYAQPYAQSVVLTGWHKEGAPDSELPWFPSEGTPLSRRSYGWRDSPGQSYDALVLAVTVTPPVDQFDPNGPHYPGPPDEPFDPSGPHFPGAHAFGYQVSTATRAYQMAHHLAYFSTLAEAGQASLFSAVRHTPTIAAATEHLIDAYLTEADSRDVLGDQAADLLTFELVRRAHTFGAGSLRDRLLVIAKQIRGRCDSIAGRADRKG